MSTIQMSPLKAILICINSMIGAGLFINAKPLTIIAGPYGFMGYVMGAVILFPLILCIAELARLHPVAGGLYVYSKTYVGSWAGFFSGWSYFVGKTISGTLLMHKFVEFLQPQIPVLAPFPTIALDFFMIFLVVALNSAGVSVGGRVQYFFTFLKAIPILFTFLASIFFFDAANFAYNAQFVEMVRTLPIALFALLGFEVICSIGNMIENPEKNIKKVIITSFLIVACVDITFQLVMAGTLGMELKDIGQPILILGLKAFSGYPVLASIINGAVFTAIIGACFSILTSNCWNLHTIAKHGHLPGAKFLTRTRANVPWVSLMIEAGLGCAMLMITSDQIPLQNMSVFAQVLSYVASAIAAWYAVHAGVAKNLGFILPGLAVLSCSYIVGLCLQRIFASGISISFLSLFSVGIIIAAITHVCNRGTNN
jgi:amino acid transporter